MAAEKNHEHMSRGRGSRRFRTVCGEGEREGVHILHM